MFLSFLAICSGHPPQGSSPCSAQLGSQVSHLQVRTCQNSCPGRYAPGTPHHSAVGPAPVATWRTAEASALVLTCFVKVHLSEQLAQYQVSPRDMQKISKVRTWDIWIRITRPHSACRSPVLKFGYFWIINYHGLSIFCPVLPSKLAFRLIRLTVRAVLFQTCKLRKLKGPLCFCGTSPPGFHSVQIWVSP